MAKVIEFYIPLKYQRPYKVIYPTMRVIEFKVIAGNVISWVGGFTFNKDGTITGPSGQVI